MIRVADIVKFVASTVTGVGVGKTVDIVLKKNLPVDLDWKARALTFIGSAALSSYISAKCSEQIEEDIDHINNLIDNIKSNAKQLEDSNDVDIADTESD